jgi:hypothetical protein
LVVASAIAATYRRDDTPGFAGSKTFASSAVLTLSPMVGPDAMRPSAALYKTAILNSLLPPSSLLNWSPSFDGSTLINISLDLNSSVMFADGNSDFFQPTRVQTSTVDGAKANSGSLSVGAVVGIVMAVIVVVVTFVLVVVFYRRRRGPSTSSSPPRVVEWMGDTMTDFTQESSFPDTEFTYEDATVSQMGERPEGLTLALEFL